MANRKSHNWLYTFNDIPQDWDGALAAADRLAYGLSSAIGHTVEYYKFNVELGKKEHLHLQAFVQYSKRVRGGSWRFECPDIGYLKPHEEVCRYPEAVATYSGKEETRVYGPFEDGVFRGGRVGQGQRSDLEAVGDAIRSGRSIEEIASDFTVAFIKHHNGIKATANILYRPEALPACPGIHIRFRYGRL